MIATAVIGFFIFLLSESDSMVSHFWKSLRGLPFEFARSCLQRGLRLVEYYCPFLSEIPLVVNTHNDII